MQNARRIFPVPKRGKPLYQPTEADRTTMLVMTAAGIKQEDIAAPSYLRRRSVSLTPISAQRTHLYRISR
jgi:hypothetical protein